VSSDLGKCKVCHATALEEIAEYRLLPRVTSDCVPFRSGGRLLICDACAAAQSPADAQWFDEIREIYSAYQIYKQSGGVEQHVIDSTTGLLRRRSEVLLDHLSTLAGFPCQGAVLDIGCGAGGTLRSFAGRGAWQLFGLEIDDRHLSTLSSIPSFDTLYTCELRDLPRQFDVVTMVHALEHFPEPGPALRTLRDKIAPGGRLFVEVPDAASNPFDYLVADHMLHSSPATLYALAASAGFSVDSLSTVWVRKELSMVAVPAETTIDPEPSAVAEVLSHVHAQLAWLSRCVDVARKASSESASFGLFGSSIAASWLCGILDGNVSFFVEEDANRIGRSHMGRPILSPSQVPERSTVYMALIPRIASQVVARLNGLPVDLLLPPPLESATAC
jgi:2-polyprenyl-3-methyl-5-hydroxy-6-metoxy-1,4-benzoquinol methylase